MRKLLSVFAAFAMALTILTGSIALPLVIRPFYRAQIEPLGIPARSGLTAEQIGAAFDDVMDYCRGVLRQAALRQLDDLQLAVPPQALDVLGGGLLIKPLLQLPHAENGYLLHSAFSVS